MLGTAQENLVNRVVDSDVENMESNFNWLMARKVDVENEIIIKLEQGRKKRKREVEVWFEDVKKVEGEYHAFGGDEAIKLNARICYLDKRSRLFGEFVVVDDRITGMPRPTTGLEGAAFQGNFERIWSLLENDQVSSIGVHGMGGVGKSTLVEHINNQLVERNKCVFWVVVSFQRCSIKMLQDKIARAVGLKLSRKDDEGARAGRLNHALSQRENFVLILDDVWERIDLVELCDGLPLGIITLAGAVSGVTEIQEWRHELGVLEESVMGHEWMEEKVFRVLKYSFDRLNPNDQRCFLYCALYPEDYKISRVELFRELIREKLVDEKKNRAAQLDKARSIVTRLVKVSLLESASDEHVKMHDLVRGMAHEITKGKNHGNCWAPISEGNTDRGRIDKGS